MTTDWRDLPEGHELDALVSERVMGKTIRQSLTTGDWEEEIRGGAPVGANIWWRCVKPYSTDIAAAWRVVERMAGLDFTVQINGPAEGAWTVAFGTIKTYRDPSGFDYTKAWQKTSKTVPLAICRAALMAVEVRDE